MKTKGSVMAMMRNEHPNPQFERESFVNLNGEWDFGFEFKGNRFKFSQDEGRALEIRNSN